MNEKGATAYSWLFVILRASLLGVACSRASWLALPWLLSEALALVATYAAQRRGILDSRSWAVPILYLWPLLFITKGVTPYAPAVLVLACLAGVQVIVRLRLWDSLTVGNPVFVDIQSEFPYSLVRHPLAFVECCIGIAIACAFPSSYNYCIGVATVCASIAAALIEEEFLQGFEPYIRYTRLVRWRFFPGVF